MNPEKIGKFICELRKEKNLSQYQLADMIPISRQGVSKWERGVTTPDPQTLMQLAEFFDVTIDELLRGERKETHSIKDLEETTLSILDQSNKKTKTIKRITVISISIITILLLSFLSYYFINSYNSMEIYKIMGKNDKFTTLDGILILTKEKYYLKLGKIKHNDDIEINNITIYYRDDNKEIVLIEDKEADNITIMDSYGYGEKLTRKDAVNLKDNLYIGITYNETETETIKLRYKRDYQNSSLFFLKNSKSSQKIESTDNTTQIEDNIKTEEIKQPEEKKEGKQVTEIKEETKPTIKETPEKEEEKQKPTESKESEKTEEESTEEQTDPQTPDEEEPNQQEPVEEVITTEQVINKIKEVCTNEGITYTCNYENSTVTIMYHSIMNKITVYKNGSLIGHYFTGQNNYMCMVDNCETIFNETYKEYLFK